MNKYVMMLIAAGLMTVVSAANAESPVPSVTVPVAVEATEGAAEAVKEAVDCVKAKEAHEADAKVELPAECMEKPADAAAPAVEAPAVDAEHGHAH